MIFLISPPEFSINFTLLFSFPTPIAKNTPYPIKFLIQLNFKVMEVLIAIIVLVVMIFLFRFFGAWMFRIDEVITNQKEILAELQKTNQKGNIV